MSIPLWLQCTHLLMYFQQDNALCHKAQIISDWFLEHDNVHFTQMASTITRSQSNRVPLGCGGTGDLHHGCVADKSAATAWCYHVNMDQNLWGMFPKELRQFWRQKVVQPGTSKLYLIKWPVSVYIYYVEIWVYLFYVFWSLKSLMLNKAKYSKYGNIVKYNKFEWFLF